MAPPWKNCWYCGKPLTGKKVKMGCRKFHPKCHKKYIAPLAAKMSLAEKYTKELNRKKTPAEQRFHHLLNRIEGIHVIPQKKFYSGLPSFIICDFAITKPDKIIFEIDGGYHDTSQMVWRDSQRDDYLRKRGWNVVRIKNETAMSMSAEEVRELVTTCSRKNGGLQETIRR